MLPCCVEQYPCVLKLDLSTYDHVLRPISFWDMINSVRWITQHKVAVVSFTPVPEAGHVPRTHLRQKSLHLLAKF
jgi:hypothetical protein